MTGFRQVRANLQALPRVGDNWTFLYIEHRRVHQDAFGITLTAESTVTQVPISSFNVLFLGPGTSITHAAIKGLTDHGVTVLWTGENAVRFYASGLPKTHKADNLYKQAKIWADPVESAQVVRRMYVQRYGEGFPESASVAVLRGHEGGRVKQCYMAHAISHGMVWKGRLLDTGQCDVTDRLNTAISAAASCLYGMCHAVIVAVGLSPAFGFIHCGNNRGTGDLISFALDIADLYRESFTIPVAFDAAARCGPGDDVERVVRRACRDKFKELNFLPELVPTIYAVLGLGNANATITYG